MGDRESQMGNAGLEVIHEARNPAFLVAAVIGDDAGGKIARYYLAQTGTRDVVLPVSPELGRPEHQEWRWVSFDEAEAVLPPRLAVILDWARATIEGH